MIDVGQVIGKPWESCYSVVDRHTGDLEEIQEPQTAITHEFFTGLDNDDDAPDDVAAAGEERKDNRNVVDDNTA